MTSSSPAPPDISSLSLSNQPSQQRLHDTYDYDGGSGNGRSPYHYATSPPIPAQSQYNPLGMSQSPLKNKPVRGGLPSQWIDNPAGIPDSRSLSPPNNSDLSSSGGSPTMGHMLSPGMPTPGTPGIGDDEIIPTAIVIKNIPFNVKRETLLDIIASLSIPTPYAFNYHLDQSGQFRGLAFANFRQSADADAVVAALNGFDVQGRKLRVEYKKVLQAGEKERIEREKAIRRMRSMQLEKEAAAMSQGGGYDEFGAVMTPGAFTPSRSFSGNSPFPGQQYSPPSAPPMPTPQLYGMSTSPMPTPKTPSTELDLNDPSTLEIYSRILLFKDDPMRDELAFSRTLTPKQRRVVHLVAQKLGVYHYSVGEGEDRYAVVTRIDPNKAPPSATTPSRQTLSRAPSSYLSAGGNTQHASLRMKKSMPDMKSLQSPSGPTAPRLTTRASNGNIREGFATIASPSRRSPGGFAALFGNSINSAFGGNGIPPVPSLPSSVSGNMNGSGMDSPGGVVRQPRGPGTGGFESRRERKESQTARGAGGFEARSHEPLEL